MSKLSYIPEIDGLRTVAVMPVILYHLGFAWIPGGFLGVDVFFVISGYLITAILIREAEKPKKEFFYDFYLRRLRRIFPAFFLVVLTTLCAAYFILLPQDFLELGRSAAASVGFVSNIYFYLNTGYFDLPAESMPLLHTWSLAVEEQFYLIWPAFILILSSLKDAAKWRIVTGVFVGSFMLSIFVTPTSPSLAFYNLPFRIFQFLLGAMIPLFLFNTILYKRNLTALSTVLQLTGFSLIAYSVFFFTSNDGFPGWLAIVPSLGASAFIVGATLRNKPQVNPMNNRLIVGIGKISFSLYLWHWPVVTLFKTYSNNAEISGQSTLWLLLLTFLLSITSYYLIEKPFRRPIWQSKSVKFSLATAASVIFTFLMLIKTDGFSHRVPDAAKFASATAMWKWDCPSKIKINSSQPLCNFGAPWDGSSRKVLLWGDSHARHLTPLLELVALKYNLSFVHFPSCRPLTDGESVLLRNKNPKRATDGCYASTLEALEIIKKDENIGLVIIAGAWSYVPRHIFTDSNQEPTLTESLEMMQRGLTYTVEKVSAMEVNVLLLGEVPRAGGSRKECAGKNKLLRQSKPDCGPITWNEIELNQSATESAVRSVAEKHTKVDFHSIIDNYCTHMGCAIFSDGEFIFQDGGHIRRNISEKIILDLTSSFRLFEAIDWTEYTPR